MTPRWWMSVALLMAFAGGVVGLGPGVAAGGSSEAPCVKAVHHDVDTGMGQACEAYVCVTSVINGGLPFPVCQFEVSPSSNQVVIQPLLVELVSPTDFAVRASAVRLNDNALLVCPLWEMGPLNPVPAVGLPPCEFGGAGAWRITVRIDPPLGTPAYGLLSVFAGGSPVV